MATSARWAAIRAKVEEALADDPDAAGLLAAVFGGPGSTGQAEPVRVAEHKSARTPAYPGVKLKPGAQGGDLTDPRRLNETPDWGAAVKAYEAAQNGFPDAEPDPESAQEGWDQVEFERPHMPALDPKDMKKRYFAPPQRQDVQAPADGLIPLHQALPMMLAGQLPRPGA